MKFTVIIARILFGLPLAVFGAMGIIMVMPDPLAAWETQEGFSPEATKMILVMWESGFLMHTVVIMHVVAVLLVLLNRFVPLALVLHVPVTIQMVLFHCVLEPETGGIAYLLLLLNVFLLLMYRDSYRGLLVAKAVPALGKGSS